ncbi:rhomboid family intramembrane serine protease [Lutibacter sp. TH_r2]|uniref:rhomboid family intramembrane serine protease n=1 Tax=Lutibacter sp. TH_r2 TaxID=3082083 RepID=UPI0029558A75|nr:rhomboid family intramembrane serine protease [Lutibacter sp. TH_r2]MDV7185770.1 rhomboid family intramembrane serine protease [Lutibacter sp. TH_r2]
MEEKQFKYSTKALLIPFICVFLCWFVYWIEYYFKTSFNSYGLYPQTIKGLRGILFSPFIHADTKHLFNNSVPLFVMIWALFYFYKKIAYKVLIYGTLLTGLLTWTFARPSYHIGASGVVYLLVSFLFFSGMFRKYYRLVALSLAIVFLYGSMIWYIFPVEDKISWEGHLSGFVIGFIFAFISRKLGPQPEKYEFTKNEAFDKLFDEDGNFNPPVEEEITDEVHVN